jgi:hypothetical protein
MLCTMFCCCWIGPMSVVLNLCAASIATRFALDVSSLAIVVHSSSAWVMLSSKNSSSLSQRHWSVFLTCRCWSHCHWHSCLWLAMASASLVTCTLTCCLSFGLMVGLLKMDKMVKALCSVIALVVFVVALYLLQCFLDTIFQSFVLVLSFNPPHRHLLSSSGYPPNLAVNLLCGLNSTSSSSHTILGDQPMYFLFQKHLSLGTLGCGRHRLNFLQWGQSFFFFFFSLVLVESSASFALQPLQLHKVFWLFVLVL